MHQPKVHIKLITNLIVRESREVLAQVEEEPLLKTDLRRLDHLTKTFCFLPFPTNKLLVQ